MADSFGLAFYKAQEAAGSPLPLEGTVLLTVADGDKGAALEVARIFSELGFAILSTEGTQAFLEKQGVACVGVKKYHEGRPNIVDAIKNGEVDLVINTPSGRMSAHDDSYIRKAAIKYRVPYITTATGALAAVRGIAAQLKEESSVRSLQKYHEAIG